MDLSSLAGRSVLVTGASGMIGRHVLPRLRSAGADVHALSRTPGDADAATWHAADLSDHEHVDRLLEAVRPTHVLHLAWETAHATYYTTPANLRWLRDSAHLLESAVRSGCGRFVGAGTSAEYDLSGDGDLDEERTPLRPNGLYGACKKALFEVTERFAAQAGFGYGWGRVFFCYGPGEDADRLLPSLLRRIDRGSRVPFQAGQGIRDYVYVEDVADAFVALLAALWDGAVNVGAGRPVTLATVVARLAELAGRPGAIDLGAVATPPYEPRRVVADTTRVRSVLGWEARRSLDDGIRASLAAWREG